MPPPYTRRRCAVELLTFDDYFRERAAARAGLSAARLLPCRKKEASIGLQAFLRSGPKVRDARPPATHFSRRRRDEKAAARYPKTADDEAEFSRRAIDA